MANPMKYPQWFPWRAMDWIACCKLTSCRLRVGLDNDPDHCKVFLQINTYFRTKTLQVNLPLSAWLHDCWIESYSRNETPWASCQIRKIAGVHAPGMPGTFSPSPQVSDPDMHHGTCVTHVPWCMSGSLTSGFLWNRRWGKTIPTFPAHAQPAILRIW